MCASCRRMPLVATGEEAEEGVAETLEGDPPFACNEISNYTLRKCIFLISFLGMMWRISTAIEQSLNTSKRSSF
jgi:hypothetical protein